MRFAKWHGIGNDFLLVTEEELGRDRGAGSAFVGEWPEDRRPRIEDDAVVAVCDRHFGVGADGILVVGPSDSADARMLIHNADGSMAQMCGNGIRIAARHLVETEIVAPTGDGSFTIETAGGPIRPTVLADGRVRVDMGTVSSEGEVTVELAEAISLTGHVLDVGNPHFVVRRAPKGPELHRLGPLAEHHERFPDRTNVEFWDVDDAGRRRSCACACGSGAWGRPSPAGPAPAPSRSRRATRPGSASASRCASRAASSRSSSTRIARS